VAAAAAAGVPCWQHLALMVLCGYGAVLTAGCFKALMRHTTGTSITLLIQCALHSLFTFFFVIFLTSIPSPTAMQLSTPQCWQPTIFI